MNTTNKTNCIQTKLLYESVESTQTCLKEYIKEQTNLPCLAIAMEQISGRGRMGRSFYSPKGSGIYFSFAFKLEETKPFTIIAASAVLSVLLSMPEIPQHIKDQINVKWVNDLRRDDKKFCGILTEMIEEGGEKYVIVGIGINLYQNDFPDEIKNIATSLLDSRENVLDAYLLAENIANKFFELYTNGDYIDIYKKHCNIIGREVCYNDFKNKRKVKVVDITNAGELVIEGDKGLEVVTSGEIEG